MGGTRKAELLAGAGALWMPALWDEPFGITLIEAMVSGTPVLGTRRGSLPEIVSPEVGALGDTLDELVELRARLDAMAPEACRAHVERHFTHHVMAEGYLRMFRAYLATGVLPEGKLLGPRAGVIGAKAVSERAGSLAPLGRQGIYANCGSITRAAPSRAASRCM